MDAFFAFHLHGHDLLHAPTFIATLSYPPNHPQFPAKALLHAICAIGGGYTSPNVANWEFRSGKNCCTAAFYPLIVQYDPSITGRNSNAASFSEEQAMLAKKLLDDNIGFGQNLLQHLQGWRLSPLMWYLHSCQSSKHSSLLVLLVAGAVG